MPNKRKAGKKLVAAWIAEADAVSFAALAEREKTTATALLTEIIRDRLAAEKGRIPSP